MNLEKIQNALKKQNVDGWLFYDFRNRDPIAMHILGLDPNKFRTRRWFYFIPTQGEPVKLVSSVEKTALSILPGKQVVYRAWTELHQEIKNILGSHRRIAMNYSPNNNIPYVSMVDGGTIELIKNFGYELISAADLIQQFMAVINEKGFQSHVEAGKIVQKIKNEAFAEIGKAIREGRKVTEYEIQQFIAGRFEANGLTDEGHHPIVGINDHPADPHFEPTPQNSYTFKKGDTVLIDLWAKKQEPGSIYYDVTWCGFVGDDPPRKYVEIFNTVRDARKAAKEFIQNKFAKGEPCYGWEVDDACRAMVKNAGYGEYFVHRTGHSIGTEVHYNGVNIDNLETKDERRLIPGICFSIEPGIYIDGEMAARSEINVFITLQNEVVVVGDEQEELILIK